ncbi:hypothetical protein BH11ACT3_BH11ACT3_15340 [soil metagenome]
MLFGKRLREHVALFAAVLGVVALLSGLSLGMMGALTRAATDGVRHELAQRAGPDLALRATLTLDPESDRQDREVRAAIANTFRSDGDKISLSVDRTVASLAFAQIPVEGVAGAGPERKVEVLSVPDFASRATLVDGAWATQPDEITAQADAAELLGVAVGDSFLVGKLPVTLVGTWRIDDYLDPRWLGDSLIVDGRDDTGFGPMIVDESVWSTIDGSPRARWTILPDVERITASQLADSVVDWKGISTSWRGQVNSNLVSLEQQGRFTRTALELNVRVEGLRAIEPVALLLLAAIGLVTLVELSRLLTTTRAAETALLWSRGASAVDVARTTAIEVGIAALGGAVIGTGAAVGFLLLTGAANALRSLAALLIVVPVGIVALAVLAFTISAFRSAQRQTVRDPVDASGRARRLVGPGLLVLVAGAAGLAVWQLRLYGSPVTPTEEGGSAIDPIAVVAPALTLVAVVLAALVLFPVVAAFGERRGRHVGITRLLAARTVARNSALVAAPIVVVAVTCGALVIAAGYSATWSDSFSRTTELRAGSDVHVTAQDGITTAAIDAADEVAGVTSSTPVELQDLHLNTDSGSIVAVAPDAFAASSASDAVDRGTIADSMRADVPSPLLAADASRAELTVTASGFATPPTVSLWLSDVEGVLRSVPTEESGSVYAIDLTSLGDTGPWQMMAIDTAIDADAVADFEPASFVLDKLVTISGDIRTTAELPPFWIPESPGLPFDTPVPASGGPGYVVGSDTFRVRLTPSFDDTNSDHVVAPVVISQRVADLYQLRVGDPLAVSLADGFDKLETTVTQIVPAIPTAPLELAVLLDIRVVQHFQLRTTAVPAIPRDLWVQTEDQERVAAALRPIFPANAFITTAGDASGRAVLGSASIALWLSAIGCPFLAMIAIVAVTRAQSRSRVLEVVVLRTIGLGSREQSALRRREMGIVLGYGALAGLVGGAAVALLTIPQLARAAVPNPYPTIATPLRFDLIGMAAGLVIIAAVLAVIIAVYTGRVAAQSRSSLGAEEVR